ncbi:MAG: PfkB family carbohydrate kinase [Ignisphaera sp.]|nr:PfkB family carbohydrate kinase [Ignisphaera sp.]MDW8085975.1 PfkB family carbohydrate kinase [Ignisphaera sp.]
MELDVCALGHVTRESERFRGVYRPFTGGPPYFLSIALKRLGSNVRVVTKLAKEDEHLLKELYDLGIDVLVIPSRYTSSFHTEYGRSLDERTLSVLSVADPFGIEDLVHCLKPSYVYVGPLTTGDFNLEFMQEARRVAPLVLDVQGFTRRVVGSRIEYVDWEWKLEGMRHVDVFKADAREASILTGTEDLVKASEMLRSWGPREVLITSSEGVYLRAGSRLLFTPFKVDIVKGRVGRGDTCLASYLHARLRGMGYENALLFAAAATSLKLREQGPLRVGESEVLAYIRSSYLDTDVRRL